MEPVTYGSCRPDPKPSTASAPPPSRYESQKRARLEHVSTIPKKPQTPSNANAVQRGSRARVPQVPRPIRKNKVHVTTCFFFGHSDPTSPCACPHKQAWGSLDSLIGRLRAAYEENGGRPETNPFAARAVRIYLREVKGSQAKARGITYQKKRRQPTVTTVRLDVV
ncbi:hypothetical protein HID58_096312 [Brassica napus]|uniref:ALOG domain-containing protein n=1 Tax=Brassica napus TaxID=3708 RepID=A0ABQ7X0T1_BRANA|nr:hypothetical protein HID58_096312 [Brassica napus]